MAGVLFDCLCVSVAQVSRHALFEAQGTKARARGDGDGDGVGRLAGLVIVGGGFVCGPRRKPVEP